MMQLLINYNFAMIINIILFSLAIASSLLIIMFKNPIYKILMLLCVSIITAIIWIMLNAEFLAMLLILVYTAIFIVLFLFIIMMLNLKANSNKLEHEKFRFSLVGSYVISILFLMIFIYISKDYISIVKFEEFKDNFLELTNVLFSEYLFIFSLISLILLLPMIAITCIKVKNDHKFNNNLTKRKRTIQLLNLE